MKLFVADNFPEIIKVSLRQEEMGISVNFNGITGIYIYDSGKVYVREKPTTPQGECAFSTIHLEKFKI